MTTLEKKQIVIGIFYTKTHHTKLCLITIIYNFISKMYNIFLQKTN